jgi:subtilisin family serine protease
LSFNIETVELSNKYFMLKVRSVLIVLLLFLLSGAQAQMLKEKKQGWHLLDLKQDGYYGISLTKAYELLKGRTSKTVIVAVIDSGIDTLQEDLKPILWVNKKEIAGNGIDDDGNGYRDDVYGWNFCGAPNGENLDRNSHEIARVYHNWRQEFEGKKEKDIPQDRKFLYGQWKKAEEMLYVDYAEALKNLPNMTRLLEMLESSAKIITEKLQVKEFTVNSLNSPILQNDAMIARGLALWASIFTDVGGDTTVTSSAVIADVTHFKNDLENKKKRKDEIPEDTRGALVKDNYTDINDRFYGNNNLKQGSGNHGTSVAGVVAAVRNNGIGIDGIADNVRIMAIRAVPGGDEHDKDVALAIRYAVDNGASIINMSFGKPVSPYKQFVDDAVRYAASKGVLLVHGSGNESSNISKDVFYPNPEFLDGKRATNYLTVGASGDLSTGGLSASFSNYSKDWVDIFAPGVFIYTTTANNGYEGADGTSFASPVAAGVAALLRSFFPSLSPEDVINIINESGTPINEEVNLPGKERKKVKFSELCKSGKIINAYGAVKLALEKEKK